MRSPGKNDDGIIGNYDNSKNDEDHEIADDFESRAQPKWIEIHCRSGSNSR